MNTFRQGFVLVVVILGIVAGAFAGADLIRTAMPPKPLAVCNAEPYWVLPDGTIVTRGVVDKVCETLSHNKN